MMHVDDDNEDYLEVYGAKGDEFNEDWYVSPPEIVDMFDLSEQEMGKSLHSCTLQCNEFESKEKTDEKLFDYWPAYIVHKIQLKDLLVSSSCSKISSSKSDSFPDLQQVAYESAPDIYLLPCGVFDSKIMFAGHFPNAYAFNTKKHKLGSGDVLNKEKMPPLPFDGCGECECRFMVELGGKLHAICFRKTENVALLCVFDPDNWTWSELPHSPCFRLSSHPKLFSGRYASGPAAAHAVVGGTKLLLFMWFQDLAIARAALEPPSKVLCYDSESQQWRQLRAPPFPLASTGRAYGQVKTLVVNHHNMNILFFFELQNRRIGVYAMSSLDNEKEEEEFVKLIGYFKLPEMPPEFKPKLLSEGGFVHIGGTKLCFVSTKVIHVSDFPELRPWLVAIPFQFDIDTSPGNDKWRFTLKFMPPCISEGPTKEQLRFLEDGTPIDPRDNYRFSPINTGCFLL